eukprot:scaffold101588_cov29-Prasinocladus_malaysianus.AAC.3
MNQKLGFTRNPRFPPARPAGGFQGRVEHRYKWGVGRLPETTTPLKATISGDPEIVINVEPPMAQFSDYRKSLAAQSSPIIHEKHEKE